MNELAHRLRILSFMFRYDFFDDSVNTLKDVEDVVKALFGARYSEIAEQVNEVVQHFFDNIYNENEEFRDGDSISSFEELADHVDDMLRDMGVEVEDHYTQLSSDRPKPIINAAPIDLTSNESMFERITQITNPNQINLTQ